MGAFLYKVAIKKDYLDMLCRDSLSYIVLVFRLRYLLFSLVYRCPKDDASKWGDIDSYRMIIAMLWLLLG